MRDLVKTTETDSGFCLAIWMDDEDYITTQLGFITFSLEKQDFKDFVKYLNKANMEMGD